MYILQSSNQCPDLVRLSVLLYRKLPLDVVNNQREEEGGRLGGKRGRGGGGGGLIQQT